MDDPTSREIRDAQERKRLQWRYQVTHAVLRGLINKHDPIGLIESGAPEDEYEPEVDRLIPRLTRAKTVADVQREIHIVFNQMFGGQAGTPDYFAALASDVWSQLINESPRSAEA